ncbi:MAG: putative CAMK family protein kinase [Streblomastix strix]|uniref:non-specific serine/threonine protein kinase n=1 Tax=Streblomastix strix TaxID=222440 RepID=A0A5J4X3H3_9EUKA|nr:MAG: putative CAMK family protein kinase [Streblomastix strix]
MTTQVEYFEVVSDYTGQEGDSQFLPISKGEIVKIIKKELVWFTVDKGGQIGKVPRGKLRKCPPPSLENKILSNSISQTSISTSEIGTGTDLLDQTAVQQIEQIIPEKPEDKLNSSDSITQDSPLNEIQTSLLKSKTVIQPSESEPNSYVKIQGSYQPFHNQIRINQKPEYLEYDGYQIIKKFGAGAMSKTFLVKRKMTGELFVMKRVDYLEFSDKMRADEEVATMERLASQFTVRLIWSFPHETDLCLILEYCEGGDLRKRVWQLFAQIILALDHLHSHGVVHRDIKPENIFLMKDNTIKLGDFGLSKELQDKDYYAKAEGTKVYMAAEVFAMKKMDFCSDIFALGVVIFELITGKHPFLAESAEAMIERIRNDDSEKLPDWVPAELKKLVNAMIRLYKASYNSNNT